MYVGQTTQQIDKRFNSYKYLNEKRPINNAIKKYRWVNFKKFVFYVHEENLDFFEIELIKRLNTQIPKGYNIESGGNRNKKLSLHTKKKISQSHKGEKNYWFGKTLSKEHIQKSSDAHKGLIPWNKDKKVLAITGKNHYKAKQIICLETGEIFDCITHAALKYNISHSDLVLCCKGINFTADNKHWSYYSNDFKLPTIEELSERIKKEQEIIFTNRSMGHKGKMPSYETRQKLSKRVLCIETQEVFNSIKDAQKIKNISHISACCNGKRKTAGGHHWKFYNENIYKEVI